MYMSTYTYRRRHPNFGKSGHPDNAALEDELTVLLQAEFSLPSLELVIDEHWDVKP